VRRWLPFVQKLSEIPGAAPRQGAAESATTCGQLRASVTASIRSVRDGSRSRAVYRTDKCARTKRRREPPPREESRWMDWTFIEGKEEARGDIETRECAVITPSSLSLPTPDALPQRTCCAANSRHRDSPRRRSRARGMRGSPWRSLTNYRYLIPRPP